MIRSVGVIILAHNEQDLLPSCLSSVRLAAQALRQQARSPRTAWLQPVPYGSGGHCGLINSY